MSLDKIYEEIGDIIRLRRKQMKLTQKDLARRVEISRASLANIESGRQRLLVHQLYKLSSVLEMEPANMLPLVSKADERKVVPCDIKVPKDDLNKNQRDQVRALMGDDYKKQG